MKLYTPNSWFDVDRLCNDDVQYHEKKNLLVDYESYEKLLKFVEDVRNEILYPLAHLEGELAKKAEIYGSATVELLSS